MSTTEVCDQLRKLGLFGDEAAAWLCQENSNTYFMGCPNFRPALIHIVEAGLALCSMNHRRARKEPQKALDFLSVKPASGERETYPLESGSLD